MDEMTPAAAQIPAPERVAAASTAPSTLLRRILEEQFRVFASEVEIAVEAELVCRVTEAAGATPQSSSFAAASDSEGELHLAVRRLRQAQDPLEICAALRDACAHFARSGAVLTVSSGRLRGESFRGTLSEGKESFDVSLAGGAALTAAIESKDPVVAAVQDREISPELALFFATSGERTLCLLPVVARGESAALLCAAGEIRMAALELLAEAAGLAFESLTPAAPAAAPNAPSELISIAGPNPARGNAWELDARLDAREQKAHLEARQFARVRIAEMKLYQPEQLLSGRRGKNLYDSLQTAIDIAREGFRIRYFSKYPSMIDYVHAEVLKSLAENDPALLGASYPGPLVR